MTKLDPKEVDKALAKDEQEAAAALMAPENLAAMAELGMKKVDPKDIRPPQILLVQKSSDASLMQTKDGKAPQPGQFYHSGKREIMDSFDCHILFAAKSKYVNKNKNNELWDQYVALGVMKDKTMFGMNFRSTYLYALSSLFTAAKGQRAPMFAFDLHVETKKIEGEKGTWFVPVVRVGSMTEDADMFDYCYGLAKDLDEQAEAVAENLNKEEDEPTS